MAPGAEEGRGKLRKASGSRKRALIRGCPNGVTRRPTWAVTRTRTHKVRGGNPGNCNILVPGGRERSIDSPSSGERKGRSPNLLRGEACRRCAAGVGGLHVGGCSRRRAKAALVEDGWNAAPQKVRVL